MARIKKGDIVLNKYASDRNPLKRGLYIGNNTLLYAYNNGEKGKIPEMQKDAEHFVVVGHIPIDWLFSDSGLSQMLDKYTALNK